MDIDQEKLEQTVLGLLYMNSFEQGAVKRAWKGFSLDGIGFTA